MTQWVNYSDCADYANERYSMPIHPPESNRNQLNRVDPPHGESEAGIGLAFQPAVAEPADFAVLQAAAGRDTSRISAQIERQAAQIGGQLQHKQSDLYRREAEFNARAARMENELRTARLLYRERELALQEKQEEFASRLSQLRQQNADMVAAQSAVEVENHAETAMRRAGLDEIRRSVEVWQKKLRDLEDSERRLTAQLADAADKQQRLDQETAELIAERREYATTLAAEQVEYRKRFDEQLQQLQARSDELECRKAAVQRMHADVTRMVREAIEIRLCTEEIWGQLQQSHPPAELAKRLAESRRKLHDQYSLASETLASEKAEVSDLLTRLESHEKRMTAQRDEMRGWVARRQAEIEEYATKLLERERELDRQGSNIRHFEHHWNEKRESLEQEIRRLKRMVG